MNPELEKFLNAERRRVVEPGPDFAARVVARAAQLPARANQIREGIWDAIPVAARPAFALALALIMAFFLIQAVVPAIPHEGLIGSAYIDGEQADESLLYVETDLLASDDTLGDWIVSEGGL